MAAVCKDVAGHYLSSLAFNDFRSNKYLLPEGCSSACFCCFKSISMVTFDPISLLPVKPIVGDVTTGTTNDRLPWAVVTTDASYVTFEAPAASAWFRTASKVSLSELVSTCVEQQPEHKPNTKTMPSIFWR